MDYETKIKNRVSIVAANARKLFGVKLDNIVVKFDIKGTSAGRAQKKTYCIDFKRKTYLILRFNQQFFNNGLLFDHLLNDTIPHEIAHLVTFERPELGCNHDDNWKRITIALGGSGQRCHEFTLTRARELKTFKYRSSKGRIIEVSSIRHNRMKKGFVYFVTGTDEFIDQSCEILVD